MTDESKDKKMMAAYVPFRTFLSAVESLEHGVPNVVDRTVWPNMSGLYQSWTLSAFRFLGLIDNEGKPTEDLVKLVADKGNRKAHLRRILERSYPSLVQHDLTKMTPASFQKAMGEYTGAGDTHRKAVSFFLQAAKFAEMPLSPYIRKQMRTVSANRKRRAPSKDKTKGKGLPAPETEVIAPNGSEGPSKTIMLGNGITLSLSTSADTFQMRSEDRQFVLRLLDELEKYESEHKIQNGEQSDEEG